MKQIAAIVLSLVLIGTGAFYFLTRGGEDNEYGRFLPQETVATLNLIRLGELTDTFAATALGQVLAKDTMHAVLTDLGGTAEDLADYDRMFDEVAGVLTNPAFRAVFGADTTVALLPPEANGLEARPLAALRGALVVVSRTTVAGALDLLSRLVKNATIRRELINGLELTRVELEPGQVLYAYAEGKMVFLAYSPAAIKRCLIAAENGNQHLAEQEPFTAAVDQWREMPAEAISARLFVSPSGLSRLLAVATTAELRQSAAMLQGIDTISAMAYVKEQGIESRARCTYRYDQLHAMIKSAVDAATRPNPTLFLLGEHSLVYNWASSLRPELITQALTENKLELQQADTAVRGLLGVGLEDLGRAFGPQYGLVLEDIVRAALFPAPKMTMFVSLRDRALAEQVVNALRARIAENGMVREEQEQVGAHTLYCWPLLADKEAQPALAMTDTMLYMATSKQGLREVLESTAPADSLAEPVATGLGTALAERVATANTGSLVLYPRRMAVQSGESLDWLAGILAATRNISITRLNREMVRLMQSVEVLAVTSAMSPQRADWALTLRKASVQPAPSAAQ